MSKIAPAPPIILNNPFKEKPVDKKKERKSLLWYLRQGKRTHTPSFRNPWKTKGGGTRNKKQKKKLKTKKKRKIKKGKR
jgi:hypothetical protein